MKKAILFLTLTMLLSSVSALTILSGNASAAATHTRTSSSKINTLENGVGT